MSHFTNLSNGVGTRCPAARATSARTDNTSLLDYSAWKVNLNKQLVVLTPKRVVGRHVH